MNSSYLYCAEAEQTGGSRVNMVGGAGPAASPAISTETADAGSSSANKTISSIETAVPASPTAGPAAPESESSKYTKALISIINSILSEQDGIELAKQVKNELATKVITELSELKSNSVIITENQ